MADRDDVIIKKVPGPYLPNGGGKKSLDDVNDSDLDSNRRRLHGCDPLFDDSDILKKRR